MEVSYQGNEEVINELIKYKLDFNLIDNNKVTALDLAIDRLGSHNLTVKKMIELGAKQFKELGEFVMFSPKQFFSSRMINHDFSSFIHNL